MATLYDYVINTGVRYDPYGFYQVGQRVFFSFNPRPTDPDLVPGFSIGTDKVNTIIPSLRGQTLLETAPIVSGVGFNEIYTNTGDFFITGLTARMQDPTGVNEGFVYDSGISGVRLFQIVTDSLDVATAAELLKTDLGTGISGTSWFLNGVKLYDEINYSSAAATDAWVDSDISVTGKLYAVNKREFQYELMNPIIPDLYHHVPFNKGTAVLYWNGIRADKNLIVETATVNSGLVGSGIQGMYHDSSFSYSETISL